MRVGIRRILVVLLLGPVLLAFTGTAVAGRASTARSLAEAVRGSVESFLLDRITMPADSVAVAVTLPVFAVEPQEVMDFSIDLLSTKPVRGTVPVKVTFLLTDGGSLAYAATARVRAFADVLVAAERLNRHEVVTEGALRLERREVTNLTDAYFAEAAEVGGKRTRRVMTPGTVIRASDVEAMPLVDRGTGVTVAVVLGKVTVTSKAKALEDGEMGELIKVQDLTTGKRLVGTVAGKSLVVLDESML